MRQPSWTANGKFNRRVWRGRVPPLSREWRDWGVATVNLWAMAGAGSHFRGMTGWGIAPVNSGVTVGVNSRFGGSDAVGIAAVNPGAMAGGAALSGIKGGW